MLMQHSVAPMLTGSELLAFVKANPGLNQQQLAVGAGYTRVTKKGVEQTLVKGFYHALLAAQGTEIALGKGKGKTASYFTTVHRSGVILLGKTYSKHFGLESGDELEISVEEDCIRLIPRPISADALVSGTEAKATA